MNAVEIEQAISSLAEKEFDPPAFPFEFLEAFGNKSTTIKRLKSGNTNSSDINGGVLQRSNIHIAVCSKSKVHDTLTQLRESPATTKGKVKFIAATDGIDFEAEDLTSDDPPVACRFKDFPDHFGFFLPLAGITTVKQIRESSFDIKATGRLNRLYIELLKHNPDWGTAERRHDMNHFMARLIFCFFAEDTNIFDSDNLFTATIEQMSAQDSSDTHKVMSEIFRAMDTAIDDRASANLPGWANRFPYVNGELFSNNTDVPYFSKFARSYFLNVGHLDWKEINPDIFGSMIQAVTDEEERGKLGLHYTSVTNILKVLNPLFLDNLRSQLEQARGNPRKLLNLRKRMANIRVFDPACGSGNFLVIAYKQMREIEAEINKQRNEKGRQSAISLKNFRGIELRDFPAKIARLALILAEYQCDVLYCGPKLAIDQFLPLDKQNWIIRGNALRIDWESVCPSAGKTVQLSGDDFFSKPTDQAEVDFDNEGGETYICSNPPYLGSTGQSKEQKSDLEFIFKDSTRNWKSLDYVSGWFIKAARYGRYTNTLSALVSTNSICQGQQIAILWPLIFNTGHNISFAYTSFKWANLASHNAGVTVVIVGIAPNNNGCKKLFDAGRDEETVIKEAENINAYLAAGENVIVKPLFKALDERGLMVRGNQPTDGGNLLLNYEERNKFIQNSPDSIKYVKKFLGAKEFIRGEQRYCLWIEDRDREDAERNSEILRRTQAVVKIRSKSKAAETRPAADYPHRFRQIQSVAKYHSLVITMVSSENREYLPVGIENENVIIGNTNFAIYDAPIWNIALIASKLHLVWIATVCGKLKTDFRYSNTLGWNTFPVPKLTESNKKDLTICIEDILIARESYFPATIADLYKPGKMPEDLRRAHDRNDEVLERIYIGRRFKNDTERLEKLFALYRKMINSTNEKVY